MATCYTLTDIDVDFILNLPEVIKAKKNIDKQTYGSIYFSIHLTPSLRKTLSDHLQLDFSNIETVPMRWIKGDTHPHVDKGTDEFDKTYLAYLTDSPGNLIIDGNSYPISKGCGYVFDENVSHETIGTGSAPRLLLGPMSEQGFAVGIPTTNITANGQTDTIYIRYSADEGIYYEINGTFNGISFPATIVNTNTDYTLKVLFDTDMTIDNNNYYFICGSSNIQFGSESLTSNGSRPVITISVENYDGLISNGSETEPGFDNIYIYNLVVDGTGHSTQIGGGWFGRNGFGNGVSNNYIVNCSSLGDLAGGEGGSGGILGGLAGKEAVSLYIIGCSSSGTIGENCGGIVGASASWPNGNIVIENCWSTGAIGINAGGIFGNLAGDGAGNAVARYCYSTGLIGAGAGGIFGAYAVTAQAIACYSTGTITADGGGIFGSYAGYNSGSTPANNCYSAGAFSVTGTGIYGANAEDDSPNNCYSANGSWTNSAANTRLTGLPDPIVGSVWVNRGVDTPYELYNMGYTPYTIQNIFLIEGDPTLKKSYSITGYQGSSLQAGIRSGLSYSILQIDDSDPSVFPTITINSTTGSISTTSETTTGVYNLCIRNTGSYNITIVELTIYETSNIPICFPAGTLVLTDQGEIEINKINIKKNTVGGNRIIAITETVPLDSYLVCIEKNSLAPNVPNRKTIISKDHKIMVNKKLVSAENLVQRIPSVYKIKYNKERLYNVLLDDYSTMSVNNLIVETMNPANPLAKIYTSMYTAQQKNQLIKLLNKQTKESNNKMRLSKNKILVKKNFRPTEDLQMLVRSLSM